MGVEGESGVGVAVGVGVEGKGSRVRSKVPEGDIDTLQSKSQLVLPTDIVKTNAGKPSSPEAVKGVKEPVKEPVKGIKEPVKGVNEMIPPKPSELLRPPPSRFLSLIQPRSGSIDISRRPVDISIISPEISPVNPIETIPPSRDDPMVTSMNTNNPLSIDEKLVNLTEASEQKVVSLTEEKVVNLTDQKVVNLTETVLSSSSLNRSSLMRSISEMDLIGDEMIDMSTATTGNMPTSVTGVMTTSITGNTAISVIGNKTPFFTDTATSISGNTVTSTGSGGDASGINNSTLDPSAMASTHTTTTTTPTIIATNPTTIANTPITIAIPPSTLAIPPTTIAITSSTIATAVTTVAAPPTQVLERIQMYTYNRYHQNLC